MNYIQFTQQLAITIANATKGQIETTITVTLLVVLLTSIVGYAYKVTK